jgi:signal transduction histidine kinase
MAELSGAEYVLVDPAGGTIAASLRVPSEQLPPAKLVDSSAQVSLGPQMELGTQHYFHSALRVPNRSDSESPGILHVLFPRSEYDAAWRRAFVPPLAVGLVAVGAVVAVTQWISRRISRSLANLGSGVLQLAEGEPTAIDVPPRDDELRDLALAINQTATRLRDYEHHLRQTEQLRTLALLGAGLAHEIRNAATGCRLAVDLHAEHCTPAAGDDTLTVAHSQLDLMETHLQQFLQLGRAEAGTAPHLVDLCEVVESMLPLVRPAAQHAGVALDWHPCQPPPQVLGQVDTLGLLVVNLLLNAIEAAQQPAGESAVAPRVEVRLTRNREQAELQVRDNGPGPAGDLSNRLFEPFVSTKAEGVGLGLAVARQVAGAHGGELNWHREAGETVFCFRIPLVASATLSDEK